MRGDTLWSHRSHQVIGHHILTGNSSAPKSKGSVKKFFKRFKHTQLIEGVPCSIALFSANVYLFFNWYFTNVSIGFLIFFSVSVRYKKIPKQQWCRTRIYSYRHPRYCILLINWSSQEGNTNIILHLHSLFSRYFLVRRFAWCLLLQDLGIIYIFKSGFCNGSQKLIVLAVYPQQILSQQNIE